MSGGELRLEEGSAGGDHVGFKAPDTDLAANVIWTLPSVDGTAGQVMVTDGNKLLTWSDLPDVASEATSRMNADSTLQSSLSAEITARMGVDLTLQSSLSAEITARMNGDLALASLATASSNGLLKSGVQGATAANTSAIGYSASTMPVSVTLASAGGSFQLITVAVAANYQNNNGTPVTPRFTIEIKNGSTVLHTKEFNWYIASSYNNKVDLVLTAIVATPTTSYTVNLTDTQNDGGAHAISNIYVTASASKIIF